MIQKVAIILCLLGLLSLHASAEPVQQEIERAQQLNDQAVDLYAQGKYQKAIALLQQSLEIRERLLGDEDTSVFASVNLLAFLYDSSGQFEKAVSFYQRAILISEKSNDSDVRQSLPWGYELLAKLYLKMGLYEKALPLFQLSLDIVGISFREEHPSLVAAKMRNLAEIYRTLGQYEKALNYYQQSLVIEEKDDPESFNVASSLEGLADTHLEMGQIEKSAPLYRRILEIRKKLLYPDQAASINNLAVAYVALGQYEQALPLYKKALAINESQEDIDPANAATSFTNLASLYMDMGKYEEAISHYQQAYRIALFARIPDSLKLSQFNLGNLYIKRGNTSAAIFFLKGAVNTMQGIRFESRGMDKALQKSLLNTNETIYNRLIDLLVDAGRLPEAQQVMSMLKEDEYFEFVRRDAHADVRGTHMNYIAAERPFADRLGKLGNDRAKLVDELNALNKQTKLGLTKEQKQRRDRIQAGLAKISKQFDALLSDLPQQLSATNQRPRVAVAKKNTDQLQATITSLGHGAVLLQYLVTEKGVRILVTTPHALLARESVIPAKELNRKIALFRQALQNPDRDPRLLGQELYQLLIAPIAEDLKRADARTLMLSLDGSLRYLPIAALYDGKSYLAEHYSLAMYTEVAKENLRTRPESNWRVAGLGVTRKIGEFKALPSVQQELGGIIRSPSDMALSGVLPGDIYLDGDFTQARFHDVLNRAYPVLHIASHFVLIPGTEAQSFLLLGDGAQLSLADIRSGGWKFNSVDLMTLSACETGLGGGRDANGREIEGFGVLAQKQGAKGVLATLWKVEDQSTAILMQAMYRARQEEHLTKADALREAQLALLSGHHTQPTHFRTTSTNNGVAQGAADAPAYTPDPDKPFAHPYYWAPFILMGNWL